MIVSGLAFTAPVWIVWSSAGRAARTTATVVDAVSGGRLDALPGIETAVLTSLTDRSVVRCAPPFGVLTESEVLHTVRHFDPPTSKGAVAAKRTAVLTTLGRFVATTSGSEFAQFMLASRDPTAPVWVLMATAPDSRFVEQGLVLSPARAGSASRQLTAYDARTGPQDTYLTHLDVEGGIGAPPRDLTALTDLTDLGTP